MTKREQLDAWCDAHDAEVTIADGLDEALVGVAQIFTTLVAIYDREQSIDLLAPEMGREAAEEYFELNTQGAYIGEQTPGFLVWRPT